MLDQLQKQICRTTVGISLTASLESLAYHRNAASLSLFYMYYFGRCLSELVELVLLPHSRGNFTRYSNRLHDFSVTIPRCFKDVYVNSFFPRTAGSEILCLQKDFRSRVDRHIFCLGSFKSAFLYPFHPFLLLLVVEIFDR